MYQRFFVLKVEIDFREQMRKKVGKGLCERDFGINYFIEKILTIM